jgi:hypothetical protein
LQPATKRFAQIYLQAQFLQLQGQLATIRVQITIIRSVTISLLQLLLSRTTAGNSPIFIIRRIIIDSRLANYDKERGVKAMDRNYRIRAGPIVN